MRGAETPIVNWYKNAVRRLLESVDPARVEAADAECKRLESLEENFSKEVPICFLGASGIGKSTLINAIVGQDILPQGGIGPLTAQALCVRFSNESAFEVQYHSPQQVARLAFALEKTYLAELRKAGKAMDAKPSELLTVEETGDEPSESIETGEDDSQQNRNSEFRKQAVVMIAGQQDSERDVPYLVDRLREMIGRKPLFGTVCRDDDRERVQRLQRAVTTGKANKPFLCLESDRKFASELRYHATGFLAPIIKDLVVLWKAPILEKNVVLVDLPGVGIAGDVHAKVTEGYIREKAKVVVLVVSVRGVTDADAQMLRSSGFLNRLLHAVDDPAADPVQLIMAVVRADDIADTRYTEDRSKKRREHFADVCTQAEQETKKQLGEHLREAWKTDETLSQTKDEVLGRILDNLRVFPVSAKQYRRSLDQDPDDPAFIQDPEESNIPKLVRSLEELALDLNADRVARRERARNLFFSNLNSNLRVVREQWTREDRAEAQAIGLRAELEIILKPIRQEFDTRRGEFRGFLRETIPSEIDKMVLESGVAAQRAITRYLRGLRDAHWSTLRASVRRGGTFYGARHIDLPNDFALRFEEPIAEVWGKKLLQLIRRRTKQYADDCVALIEQILDWAKNHGARVKITLLEAQRDQVKSDAQQLTIVGKELLDELREEVKNRLISSIRGPIRQRCQRFVDRQQDVGVGVRNRILELFDELAEHAVSAATEPAKVLLTSRFKQVETEISKILRTEHDPIAQAAEAVVESHETTIRRSDAQRRGAVIRQLDEIDHARPVLLGERAEVAA